MFPKTKLICFSVIQPWKVKVLADLDQSNQIPGGTFKVSITPLCDDFIHLANSHPNTILSHLPNLCK